MSATPDQSQGPSHRLRVRLQSAAGGQEELESLVRKTLGSGWEVRPLLPARMRQRPDSPLARYYILTAPANAGDKWQMSRAAWDHSYALGDAAPALVAGVEPDLPHTNFGPDAVPGQTEVPLDLRAGVFGICDPPPNRAGTDNKSWALDDIHWSDAEALPPGPDGSTDGEGVVIGHPDTGYTDHPELQDEYDLTLAYNVIDDNDNARDPLTSSSAVDTPGHGTLTASVIASRPAGVINGAAPAATIVPIRTVTSVFANVYDTNVAVAIEYARQIGCHVISMSLGGLHFEGAEAAVNAAIADGLIVIAAAGNCVPFVVWPAAYANCIAVGASTIDDTASTYSSKGSKVAISAPGESVWGATFNYGTHPPAPTENKTTGTSLATANLAGVAAYWLAFHGRDALVATYGQQNVQAVFLHQLLTAGYRQPAGWDTSQYGVGIVDLETLLEAPLPDPALVSSMRAQLVAQPSRPDATALLRQVCPELSDDEINTQLAALLGAQGAEPAQQRERYAGELLYILGEDPNAREAFVAGARRYPTAAAGQIDQTAIRDKASDSLRRAMSTGA